MDNFTVKKLTVYDCYLMSKTINVYIYFNYLWDKLKVPKRINRLFLITWVRDFCKILAWEYFEQ